jgi:hypothetical protein
LFDVSDVRTKLVAVKIADVVTAKSDRAVGDVVEAFNEREDG